MSKFSDNSPTMKSQVEGERRSGMRVNVRSNSTERKCPFYYIS